MAFSKEQRRTLIETIITANSALPEAALETFSDNQLVAVADRDKLDKLVNNAAKQPPQLKQPPVDDDLEDDGGDDDLEDEDEDDEPAMPPPRRKGKKMSANQYLAAAPPEIRQLVANARRQEATRRQELIETITANENCPLTASELQERATPDLEAFALMAGNQPSGQFNYLGVTGGPGIVGNRYTEPALPMPGTDYMKAGD